MIGRYASKKLLDIRPATACDVAPLRRLEMLLPDGWAEKQISRAVASKFSRSLGLMDGRYVIGWVSVFHVSTGTQLRRIAIHPDHRRRGYGRDLLREVFALAPGASSCDIPHVPIFDTAAIFLCRCGWRGESVTKDGLSFLRFRKEK